MPRLEFLAVVAEEIEMEWSYDPEALEGEVPNLEWQAKDGSGNRWHGYAELHEHKGVTEWLIEGWVNDEDQPAFSTTMGKRRPQDQEATLVSFLFRHIAKARTLQGMSHQVGPIDKELMQGVQDRFNDRTRRKLPDIEY